VPTLRTDGWTSSLEFRSRLRPPAGVGSGCAAAGQLAEGRVNQDKAVGPSDARLPGRATAEAQRPDLPETRDECLAYPVVGARLVRYRCTVVPRRAGGMLSAERGTSAKHEARGAAARRSVCRYY